MAISQFPTSLKRKSSLADDTFSKRFKPEPFNDPTSTHLSSSSSAFSSHIAVTTPSPPSISNRQDLKKRVITRLKEQFHLAHRLLKGANQLSPLSIEQISNSHPRKIELEQWLKEAPTLSAESEERGTDQRLQNCTFVLQQFVWGLCFTQGEVEQYNLCAIKDTYAVGATNIAVESQNRYSHITFLASSPQSVAFPEKYNCRAGTRLIIEAARLATLYGKQGVSVYSSLISESFYKKLGFTHNGSIALILKKEDFFPLLAHLIPTPKPPPTSST